MKKKYMKRTTIITCALFLAAGIFSVCSVHAGSTGAAFLKISPDSRASGMGGAYTALADSASALWWNPGGLAGIASREITGTHAEWLAGTSYDFFGYAHPTAFGTIAVGITAFNVGSIESRDVYGNKGGNFDASDLSVSVAYARRVGGSSRMGMSMKYLKQSIASEDAVGYAFDIGGITSLDMAGLDVGYGIYNLGPKMRFLSESYDLPLRMAVGLGYKLNGMRFALDMHRDYHLKKTYFSFGTEYSVLPVLSLRAGYLHNSLRTSARGNDSVGGLFGANTLRAGFGINMMGHKIDYAFVPYGDLGATHRISFSSSF